MTNGLTTLPPGLQVPAAFGNQFSIDTDDLSGGVGGLPILSVRGRVFRFKYRGLEQPIVDANGYAIPYLDVLIVKAASSLSKIFYAAAYNEGDDNQPDCWSADGVLPDPSAPAKQAPSCAACPKNVWGSKTTPQGNQTKACADSRRLAIVPAWDPMNPNWGGVALLRIPPASLAELAIYSGHLRASGLPYQAAVTRLKWDMNVAFPKLVYEFVSVVSEDQAKAIMYWHGHEQTNRLLSAPPQVQPAAAPAGPAPYQQPQPSYPQQPPPQGPVIYAQAPMPQAPMAPSSAGAPPVSPQAYAQPAPVAPAPAPARPEPPPGWAWNEQGNGFVQVPVAPAQNPMAMAPPAAPPLQAPQMALQRRRR